MLTHLADRPLTMIRMPEGIGGERFFQKHWDPELPAFAKKIHRLLRAQGRTPRLPAVRQNLPTLLWLAQSRTLEFHVWHSRREAQPRRRDAEHGLQRVLAGARGLDPQLPRLRGVRHRPLHLLGQGGAGRGTRAEHRRLSKKARKSRSRCASVLAGMGLEAVAKTSGKTGLHIFVPIERTLDFDAGPQGERDGRAAPGRLRPKDVTVEWSVPGAPARSSWTTT